MEHSVRVGVGDPKGSRKSRAKTVIEGPVDDVRGDVETRDITLEADGHTDLQRNFRGQWALAVGGQALRDPIFQSGFY